MPALVIVGARGVGKTELWARVACDLSGGVLALYEAGAVVRLTPTEARTRFVPRARREGRAAPSRVWHGVRRLRILPGTVTSGSDPAGRVLWLVDGPGLDAGDADAARDGRGDLRTGLRAREVSRLLEQVLLADALIHVQSGPSGRDGGRLERALRGLAVARGIQFLAVSGRRPVDRPVPATQRLLEDTRFARDLRHLERELLRRYGQPGRPGADPGSRGSRAGGGES